MTARARVALALASALALVWGWGGGSVGRAQGTFFDLGVGVRALGMGEAFTALADDAGAALYNPAGLALLSRGELSSFYERRFGASNYLSALGALPRLGLGSGFGLGGGLFLFDFGRVEGRDEEDTPTEAFGYLQLGLLAALGLPLDTLGLGSENFALGAQLKVAGASSAPGAGGLGAALGLGFLGRFAQPAGLPFEEVRLGLALHDLGFGLLRGPKARVGVAVRPLPEWAVALDVGVPFALGVGTELQLPLPSALPAPETALRAGLAVRPGMLQFSLGLGIAWGPVAFDYAFLSHPQLPGSHRLALSWRF